MKKKTLELFDFEKINLLLKGFNKSTGFVTAILDLEGKVLSQSGWREICTCFHRVHPETSKRCTESDTKLAGQMEAGEKYHFYKCLNGLVDVAVPIIINNEHVANLFTGQFFFKKPDRNFFIKQAENFGFDKKKYLDALDQVPIVSEEKVKDVMGFLLTMTLQISAMAMQKTEQEKMIDNLKANEKKLKTVNQQLFTSEKKYRNLIENMQDMVFRYELLPQRKFTYVSPNSTNFIGYTPQEHYDDPQLGIKIAHPDDRHILEEYFSKELLREDTVVFRWIKKDGRVIWAEQRYTPTYDDEGQLIAVEGISRNITKSINAKNKLEESEKKYKLLAENTIATIWVMDPQGNFTYYSPSVMKLRGYTPEEAENLSLEEIMTPKSHSLVQSLFKKENNKPMAERWPMQTIELEMYKKDGSIVFVETSLKGVRDINENISAIQGGTIDITERKKAEEELNRNLEVLTQGEDIANLGYFERDWKSGKGFWSKGFYRLLDENSETVDCMHEEFTKYIHPKDRQRVAQHIQSTFKNKTNMNVQFRLIQTNGNTIHIHGIGKNFFDEFGKAHKTIGTFLDITERIKTEKRLKEGEEKYRVLAENAKHLIITHNFNGKITYANDYALAYINLPKEQVIGSDIAQFILGKKEKKQLAQRVKEFQANKDIIHKYELDIILPRNKKRILELYGNPIKLNNKNDSVLVIGYDITERKLAEKELKESEEKYRLLAENSSDCIWAMDKQLNFTYLSPALERITGFKPEEWEGTSLGTHFTKEEYLRVSAIANKHIKNVKTHNPLSFESKMLNKADEQIDVEIRSTVLLDKKGGFLGMQGITSDISKRKQAEAEKMELEAHLRQEQKLASIGTLAGGVAHEINNPLTGIMNYAQLIHERIDPAENRLREFSKEIIFESERVAEIVRNLLTFSRQENESHSPTRIVDVLDGTLSLIRTVIKRDQIKLEVDVPDDLPTIKCRSQQIQQVIMNLLTNARDALNIRYPEYDPEKIISVRASLFEKEGRRWVRTTIEDRGAGIPIEIRERIFDPFYTTKDRATGTGLGLSISLGIVQDHHGKLTFESEENKFTRFYLDLPVVNDWETEEKVE